MCWQAARGSWRKYSTEGRGWAGTPVQKKSAGGAGGRGWSRPPPPPPSRGARRGGGGPGRAPPHLQLGDVLLLQVGVVGVHPVELQRRAGRAAAGRRRSGQKRPGGLLQPGVGAAVVEAGGLPRGGDIVVGEAGLGKEEHPGEVVIDAPGQAALVHRRPHALAADHLQVVLVPLLQLFEQEVDLLLQNDILFQEYIGALRLPHQLHPAGRRVPVLLQPGAAVLRLLQSRLQLRRAAAEQFLLPIQQGEGLAHRPPLQIGPDGAGGNAQLPEGADDVEGAHVLDAVHAVAVLPPNRVEQPLLLIVAQRVGAEVEKLGQLVDLIKLFQKFSLQLLTFGYYEGLR